MRASSKPAAPTRRRLAARAQPPNNGASSQIFVRDPILFPQHVDYYRQSLRVWFGRSGKRRRYTRVCNTTCVSITRGGNKPFLHTRTGVLLLML